MQPNPVRPPPTQLTLPFGMIPLTAPPHQTEPPRAEQAAVEDLCTPEQTWRTLNAPERDRLRRVWVRVLKEVVDDAQKR